MGNFTFLDVDAFERSNMSPSNREAQGSGARLDKCLAFSHWIFQDELYDYKWKWKDRSNPKSYGQFFSNYGMNRIPKDDFIFLCSLAISEDEVDSEFNQVEIDLTKKVQEGQYDVPDKYANVKTRGAAQKVFSNKLGEVYNNKCCITGISTSCMLIGAHIIPWSKRQDTRLNPQNGLLLSVLMDRLFENGFISIDDSYIVHVSELLKEDVSLYKLVCKYDGKRLALPAHQYRPDKSFLREKLNLNNSNF
jgi:putative restriction endonuclease